MSGRRRSLLATVLRGGSVGRRIRVRALLLSSSRSDFAQYDSWLRFEVVKGVIPLIPPLIAGLIGRPLPSALSHVLMAAGFGWMIFVLVHASVAAFRMNRRHAAYMKAAGVDTDLRSILNDKALWRQSANGLTMREFIAARNRPPTATEPVQGATSKANSKVRCARLPLSSDRR